MTSLSPARRCTALLALALLAFEPWPSLAASGAYDEATIVHVLNRLAYGPRPGDVERVQRIGLMRWIEQQLEPERLPDPAMGPRLAELKTVGLSSHQLLEGYEIPPAARRELAQRRGEMENAGEGEKRDARRAFMEKYAPQMEGPPRQVLAELQEAKVLRAVYGERQLDEVLVDFWLNHFNVFAQKGPEKFLLGEYERDVLRPHAWGKFEDLLLATALSPAMLFYLDNWLSADPNARPPRPRMRRRPAGAGQGQKRGLNENYAREIMELHTLGVDGGYTQKDVTEVARCFTGWTIKGLREERPEFHFEPRFHDPGDKVVLGLRIKGGGQDEGRTVIHLLATHPRTARFVSSKLVRKLVADDPPPILVDRATEAFRKTDGDVCQVVRAIVTSPEFLGPDYRGVKVKTPFEFVVSAVRAAGASVAGAAALAQRVGAMGMPLYMQQPPTGYKDTAEAWVSTGGLLARLNFALDLAGGRVQGVSVDPSTLAPGAADGPTLAAALATRLVPQGLSESTRKTIDGEAGSGMNPARIAGLVLGSPEFQRR